MIHYLIELAIWMLLAYFLGCFFGWAFRSFFGKPATVEKASQPLSVVASPVFSPPPSVKPKATPTPVAPSPAPTLAKMERPKGIAAARDGKADDLQRISGIGPKNESILHTLGFFHFDQIAAWTEAQISWVDDHLRFNGRIKREEWSKQAGLLAAGKDAEFTKLYGTGGLLNNKGETLSGSRTRK
jgi:predicted flap endonuclease-1-like 5' DNA nuclease